MYSRSKATRKKLLEDVGILCDVSFQTYVVLGIGLVFG